MTDAYIPAKTVRLAVIVSNFGAAVNVGGGVDTEVKVFDLPSEVSAYISTMRNQSYTTVTLGVECPQ